MDKPFGTANDIFTKVVSGLPQADVTLTEALPDGEDPVPLQPVLEGREGLEFADTVAGQAGVHELVPLPYLPELASRVAGMHLLL